MSFPPSYPRLHFCLLHPYKINKKISLSKTKDHRETQRKNTADGDNKIKFPHSSSIIFLSLLPFLRLLSLSLSKLLLFPQSNSRLHLPSTHRSIPHTLPHLTAFKNNSHFSASIISPDQKIYQKGFCISFTFSHLGLRV